MKYLLGGLVLAMSACTTPSNSVEKITPEIKHEIRVGLDNPAIRAFKYINYTERTHRAELKELTGIDPVRTEWCAAFVNAVLEESDIVSNNDHKYPLTARAFLQWGTKVTEPKPGDIVVFPRGNSSWQGHVGFYVGSTDNYWIILGGNQDNTVSYKLFKPKRAIGIRRWVE